MDAFVIVALIGFALLFFELLLPTGGVLAALGIAGVVAAGVLALGSDSDGADVIGPALITLGILSGITFYYVTRKVIAAHQHQPVRAGTEQLVGAFAEARSTIDPEGQVWLEGTLWSARLASEDAPAQLGDRVRVEAVDGLTLVVSPEPEPAEQAKEGVS
ncbi:MAG TPA: NfeD family protein [Solirubrobacterales bacterium]|nr:NfeD family protein [Solirubrobacterales bacterium]